MTDDKINDLVSAAAKAHDADFGSLAIYAALKAATEDRIHTSDDLIDDGPDASGPPPERAYIGPRRRDIPRLPRRFLAAVAAIAFIATCAAGVALSQDDTPRELDEATTTTVSPETLKEQIIAASRVAYSDSIVHRRLTYTDPLAPMQPDSVHDSWNDDSTRANRYRSATLEEGEDPRQEGPALDHGLVTFDGIDAVGTRTVDHCFSEFADGPSEPSDLPRETSTDYLEEDLEAGRLVVDGREVFKGRDAIRLRIAPPDPRDGFVWLDATTLLPFWSEGRADSDGAFTEAFEFLPRSDKNFDLLVPPVPAGYTKVDTIPDDRGTNTAADCPS
jgi:hypothetical protein